MADEDKVIEENTANEEAVEDKEVTETSEDTEAADDGSVKKDDSAVEEGEENKEKEEPEKEKEDDKTEDVNPEDVDLESPEEVSDALNKKGIDYNALAQEYIKNGSLSEQSMSDLAAAGIPPEMVNDYIKGYEARAELERNELAECVGGKEALEEIITWASKNLAKEEIIALNEIRNKFELKAVLRGLKTDMEEKEGKAPEYQKGTGDKPTINGFRSQAEMFEAIKDPKYKNDEAYRADVQKKIAASREAGIDLGIY